MPGVAFDMEYNTFASKDAFQISSGDNTKKGAQTKSSNLLPLGLGALDQSASSVTDAVVSQDSEASSFLNLDTSYKQKLRSGVIEFLNTVHDSKYRVSNAFAKRSFGYSGQGFLARSCEIPVVSSSDAPLNHSDQPFQSRSHKRLNEKKKLYRSNSSLELDHFNEDANGESVVLNRDYGSANSLDATQHFRNRYSPSFQSYRQGLENLNRLAKEECDSVSRPGAIGQFAPTNKGIRHISANGSTAVNPSNLLLNMDGSGAAATGDPPQSPRPETKFQKTKESKARNEGGGIFRKLRGVKSDPSAAASLKSLQDANPRADVGSKAFCHYDCQSVSVRMSDVIKRRTEMNNDVNLKRLNVTTGASAASVATRIVPSNSTMELDAFASNDESDDGDGKSNDMLLSCSFFHNELGGEAVRSVTINQETAQRRFYAKSGGGGGGGFVAASAADHMTDPLCNAVQVVDCSLSPKEGFPTRPFQSAGGYVFEYFDNGAHYYRHFFSEYEHQNFFGIDDNIGPVAISIRREKVFEKDATKGFDDRTDSGSGWFYQYRIIVRTSELTSLRGSILEDNIPSSSRLSSAKGLLAKDILEFIVPSLNISCLHQAMPGPKTSELLTKVDEQGISKAYKIGIMLCRAGQATEEEMYNNETSSPSFDEFLNLIGSRIKLKGFDNYRGGLDVKSDSTGKESLYTKLEDYEIMFHVSTLLPFTPNNKQQLLRKRHIGNDIVTIIFQEPGALPFTPKSVRSQFQHVFIVVKVHNPGSENAQYSVAVSRSKNVPYFGPLIPDYAHFSRSEHFKEFLLVKAINAENAVHKSDKFMAMAVRTRQEYLKDLAINHVSSSIESGSRLSKLTLGSGRKKDKMRLVRIPDIRSKAAVVWNVHVEDFVNVVWIGCHLGIASEVIVIVEELTSCVLFTTSCQAVIGWTLKPESNSLRLFINQGECIFISANGNDLKEIVSRLEMVTTGSHTEEKSLYRNSDGHLGFHVYDGIVSEIDSTGPAFLTKLKPGSNIVEVCSVIVATLSQNHLVEFLRTSKNVTISVIPPHDNGVPRSYKGGPFDGLTVEPLKHQAPVAQLWRQHHSVPTASNHSSLERKEPEQSKASMNDLHSVNETGLKTEVAECSSSGELHVTFHTAYQAQNAYKGSHLSLLHKSDPIGNSNAQKVVRSVGASASVPYGQTTTAADGNVSSRNNVTSSGASASAFVSGEESKQAAMSRKLTAAVEQLYQSPNLRSHEAMSNWFSSGDSAPAKSYVLQNFHLNSDMDRMQQLHLSHSQSFNKGNLYSTSSDHSRLMPQQQQQPYPGPELLADSSDSVNSDSKTKYRKSVNARMTGNRLTPSKSFQKDLIRLIDTEVPPSEILISSNYDSDDRPETLHLSQHCHSDDNICASTQRSYSSLDGSHSELHQQKMRSNVVEIPGTIYRLQTSHSSTAIPLPVASNTRDDWSSLVDAAERTFEVELKNRGLHVETPQSSHSPFAPVFGKASSAHKTQNSVEAIGNHTPRSLTHRGPPCQDVASDIGQSADEAQTDATRIKDLEAKVASLDRKLQVEKKERMVLELEMDKLRQDNVRLQVESQTAATQLRRFTEWFFKTIDKR